MRWSARRSAASRAAISTSSSGAVASLARSAPSVVSSSSPTGRSRLVTQALVAARVGDDQAEVRVDQAFLGGQVAALDALGQLDLLGAGEQPAAPDLGQEQRRRVHDALGGRAVRAVGRRGAVGRAAIATGGGLVSQLDPALREQAAQRLELGLPLVYLQVRAHA
jgi:hypothetical protein